MVLFRSRHCRYPCFFSHSFAPLATGRMNEPWENLKFDGGHFYQQDLRDTNRVGYLHSGFP
jgi:hypothetical protein